VSSEIQHEAEYRAYVNGLLDKCCKRLRSVRVVRTIEGAEKQIKAFMGSQGDDTNIGLGYGCELSTDNLVVSARLNLGHLTPIAMTKVLMKAEDRKRT